uniref:NADH:ubiquinone oxidoreductase complex assembly factor 8 n=1 Tax=Pan paniscus TaxID=9597 RepID=A0A2R9AQN2_PANPA
ASAQERLWSFPILRSRCAAAYGRCVQASTAPGGRLSKDFCAREFEALRSCFAAAAKKTLEGGC